MIFGILVTKIQALGYVLMLKALPYLRARRLRILNVILLAVVIVGVIVYQLMLWLDRPMFRNEFRRHHRGILFQWIPEVPHVDGSSNAAIADYRSNLLVVFLGEKDNVGECCFGYPYYVDHDVYFSGTWGEEKREFIVQELRDVLILFLADGTQEQLPLASGEAKRMYTLIASDAKDLIPLVEHAYSERHSAKDILQLEHLLHTPKGREEAKRGQN